MLIVVRVVHVAATLLLFGTLLIRAGIIAPALAGLPPRLRPPAWEGQRRDRLLKGAALAAPLSLLVWVLFQAGDMASADLGSFGGMAAAAAAVPTVLGQTWFGHVQLIRAACLLVALVVLLWAGPALGRRTVLAGLGAAGLAVVLLAAAGHLATEESGFAPILGGIHLLAAASWLGGLPAFVLFLRTAPPKAAAAISRRFSPLGAVCVCAIVISGTVNAYMLTGTLAGLIGTFYGQLLLVKTALLLGLLALAWVHRYRMTPALDRSKGALVVPRFQHSLLVETLLGLTVVAVAGLLSSSPPAMHEQPVWPFAVRFSRDVLDDPDLGPALWNAIIAMALAATLLLLAVLRKRLRWPAVLLAVLLFFFAQPQLPLLLAQAYPTSFMNSPTGDTAASVVAGHDLFIANCTSCHGADGRGDGPQAKSLAVPPADLTAEHLWDHRDGDLFWWIGHGIEEDGKPAMPGFEGIIEPEERWNLIDYLHAHNAGLIAGASWERPIAAPDLDLHCPEGDTSLAELRPRFVLLALEPDAAAGAQLAAQRAALTAAGIMPVLVTSGGAPPAGPCSAQDGAAVTAYAQVAGLPVTAAGGTQFIIDGDGWLRMRRRPGQTEGWHDQPSLLAAVEALRQTPLKAPAGMGNMKM